MAFDFPALGIEKDLGWNHLYPVTLRKGIVLPHVIEKHICLAVQLAIQFVQNRRFFLQGIQLRAPKSATVGLP